MGRQRERGRGFEWMSRWGNLVTDDCVRRDAFFQNTVVGTDGKHPVSLALDQSWWKMGWINETS